MARRALVEVSRCKISRIQGLLAPEEARPGVTTSQGAPCGKARPDARGTSKVLLTPSASVTRTGEIRRVDWSGAVPASGTSRSSLWGGGDWLTDALFDPRSSGLLLCAPPATPRWCAGRDTSVRHRLDSCTADPFAGLVATTALATGRAAELHVRNPA